MCEKWNLIRKRVLHWNVPYTTIAHTHSLHASRNNSRHYYSLIPKLKNKIKHLLEETAKIFDWCITTGPLACVVNEQRMLSVSYFKWWDRRRFAKKLLLTFFHWTVQFGLYTHRLGDLLGEWSKGDLILSIWFFRSTGIWTGATGECDLSESALWFVETDVGVWGIGAVGNCWAAAAMSGWILPAKPASCEFGDSRVELFVLLASLNCCCRICWCICCCCSIKCWIASACCNISLLFSGFGWAAGVAGEGKPNWIEKKFNIRLESKRNFELTKHNFNHFWFRSIVVIIICSIFLLLEFTKHLLLAPYEKDEIDPNKWVTGKLGCKIRNPCRYLCLTTKQQLFHIKPPVVVCVPVVPMFLIIIV